MLRFILTIIMVILFPFAVQAQEMERVATYPITGYALGKYDARTLGQEIALEASCKLEVVGSADATPYRTGNSALLNQALADRRGNDVAKLLTDSLGISPERIDVRGEVSANRGPQYRGVTIYVVCPKASAPAQGDSLAMVAREVDTLETEVAQVATEVKQVRDTVTQVAEKVDSIIAADSVEKKETEKGVTFEVAPGYSASENNVFTVGPAIGVGIKDTKTRLVFQPGIAPASKDQKLECSKGHLSLALGLERQIGESPFGVSVGGFTDRTFCYDGGPRVAETLTYRRDGVYLGGSLKPDWGFSRRPVFTLQLTVGATTTLENQKPRIRPGVRTGLRIPIFGQKAVKDTTVSPSGR